MVIRRSQYDLAISYGQKDEPIVRQLTKHLSSAGVRIYDYKRDITNSVGRDLYSHLEGIYNTTEYNLLILSKNYNGEYAMRELTWVTDRNKAEIESGRPGSAIVVRLDDTQFFSIPHTMLSRRVDITRGSEIEELAAWIMECMGPRGRSGDNWEYCIDGYCISFIEMVNDSGVPVNIEISDLDVQVTGGRYELSKIFPRLGQGATRWTNKPSVRLVSYSMPDRTSLNVRLQETRYADYLRGSEFLDVPIDADPEKTYREYFGNLVAKNEGRLDPFPLSNICGVGLFIITRDRYIVLSKLPNEQHVYPGRWTFSTSGVMKWGAHPDPFSEVVRRADEKIGHLVNIKETKIVGFGVDSRKLYFQFSFYEMTTVNGNQILPRSRKGKELELLPMNVNDIVKALLDRSWEPAAEVALINICNMFFGGDAVKTELQRQRSRWVYRQIRDEFDFRGTKQGDVSDMSVRYPRSLIDKESKHYIESALNFMGISGVKTILEIGSGSGRFTERFLRQGCKVTAVEISPTMIKKMLSRLNAKVLDLKYLEIRLGCAQDILPVSKHDIAVCSQVLIHNVTDDSCRNLIRGLCMSANKIYVMEDVSVGRKTSRYTKLRPEDEIISYFKQNGFRQTKLCHYSLFNDNIAFIEFSRDNDI